jgi:ATP-binding cassette subfamily B protein
MRVTLRLAFESWSRLGLAQRLVSSGLVLGMAGVAALESFSIGLVFPLITVLAGGEPTQELGFVARAVDITMPSVRAFALALLVLFLCKNALVVGVTFAQARFLGSVARSFGDLALRGHLAAPYEQHLARTGADMTASVVGRLYTVLVFLYEPLFIIASEVLVVAAIVIVLVAIEPLYSVVVLGFFAILGVVGNVSLRRHAQRAGKAKDLEHRKLLQFYGQTLNAIDQVQTANRPEYFLSLIRDHLRRYADSIAVERFIVYMPRSFVETGVAVFLFGGLAYVVSDRITGAQLVGLMALFAAAAVRLMPAASRILYALTTVNLAREAFDHLLPDLDARATAPPPRSADPRPEFKDALELRDVRFRYATALRPAVDGVSLSIRRGEKVGILGPSGSGKSTLLRLMAGLLRPAQGRILLDGRRIGDSLGNFWELVGYVPQEPVLLDGSVRDNIVFGWDGGDSERLCDILRLARLDSMLMDLPAGIDTIVGASAHKLSRGQLQRIAITRALYREPKILILDEPTASLDHVAEDDVSRAIMSAGDGVTVIVVSHNPASMHYCDRVISLDAGRIVADERRGAAVGHGETVVRLPAHRASS